MNMIIVLIFLTDAGNELWMEDEISMKSDTWVKNVHQDNMMYSPNMMVSVYLFDSFGNLLDSTNVETDEVEMEIDDESLEDDLAVDDSEE